MAAPPDQREREAALDPGRSFIVQAPAGSGKTELLIQRYLRLLALVDEPEEVLAVTFTRKAAGEMRSRVCAALAQAQSGEAPAAPHLRRAFDLACAVLGDEHRRQWQLHRHPARLSISTLDAVNAWVAGRTPVAAGSSALQGISPAPERLYREAARATLELMADDDAAGAEVAALMRHVDNDAARFERLLVAMLPRRDQWLRHAVNGVADRTEVEAPLRRLTGIGLEAAAALLPSALAAELLRLLPRAAAVQAEEGRPVTLQAWAGRRSFPAPLAEELPAWRALADALLTAADAQWRKSVDVRGGFPARSAEKTRMEALLRELAGHEALRVALDDVRSLPGAAYDDGQWEVLRSLLGVLRLAAAQLRLVAAARGETDFAEVAAAALAALGGADEPSELGLLLDHRVRHVLVDEFQDTSLAQFTLLERLTAGWSPDDGRTLFLVGDPMQSIYRFREADVGLFMRVRDGGIGQLRPQFLQLRANFRSAPGLVSWCNEAFARTFAPVDDALAGAVRFAPSLAANEGVGEGGAGVSCHWLPAGDETAEPARVLALAMAAQRADPAQRVCVLVRSRSHASAIIAALRAADVGFVAPEIELLDRSGVAQDLLALARALCHRGDRLAWIGVLRAPWCGLTLDDLHRLLADDLGAAVPDLLNDPARVARLSAAGQAATRRLRAVLDRVAVARERRGLRDLVEGAWLRLGGPATVPERTQLESAATFLDLLDEAAGAPGGLDLAWLTAQLGTRKGSLGSGDTALQIMTIHKAKGLEFDTVIVPGLGKLGRPDEPPLLLWQDVPMPGGGEAPVLAPLPATGAGRDAVYGYLRQLERRKAVMEMDRLLYVACTRARRQLHLVAQIEARSGEGQQAVRRPRAGSLLERLWPAVGVAAEATVAGADWPAPVRRDEPVWVQPVIRRLPPSWEVPGPPAALPLAASAPRTASDPVPYEWAGRLAMHVGSVVHRWLQQIAEEGLAAYPPERLPALQPAIRRMLAGLGVAAADLEVAVARVDAALAGTLADARGRWLLDAHEDAASELALTVCEDGRFRSLVVDRSFRDADGTRWVVDFKTSPHLGGDLEAFLRSEVDRYREQLRSYREALRALTGEPVRTALYFPLLRVFREVDAGRSGGTCD